MSLSSDEELLQAWEPILQIADVNSGCLKLFVKERKNHGQQRNDHPGVTCDGCDSNIKGIRYKCTKCFDFDLCSACEDKNQHPEDHEMICIKAPRIPTRRNNMWNPIFPSRHFRSRPCGGFPFDGFVFSATPSSKKSDESTQKQECVSGERSIEQHIATLASCFGLDPDVAKCYFATFCDDLGTKKDGHDEENQSKSQKEKPNGSNQNTSDSQQKSTKNLEDLVSDMATAFGVQQEFLNSFLNPFLPQNIGNRQKQDEGEEVKQPQTKPGESKKRKDEDAAAEEDCCDEEINKKDQEMGETKTGNDEMVNDGDSRKTSQRQEENGDGKLKESTFKEELETMVRGFSEQFGLPTEHQQNFQGGLESLLQGMFNLPNYQQQSAKGSKVHYILIRRISCFMR